MNTSLETDDFLTAVREILIASDAVPELGAGNVVAWHAGQTDPLEDTGKGSAIAKGVAAVVMDFGGNETGDNDDLIRADGAIELFVDTSKHRGTGKRKGGQIRDAIMRLIHRHTSLRNTAAFADARVTGYQVIEDKEFAAWRIHLTRTIYLSLD